MAIRINFDSAHNAEQPTLVLATRKGKLIGKLPVSDLRFNDTLNSGSTAQFNVNKTDAFYNKSNSINDDDDILEYQTNLWNQLKDFKLVWAREWNTWFEIKVDTQEDDAITKSVSATSLGEAELSQINLYDYEINTDTDIEREDYIPTVLYDEDNPKASLLNRILEKAPHYTIAHVDFSIANIQRTFSFDSKSIYDAFQEIAEEIDCLFRIRCYTNGNGELVREINVYDLETYCLACGHRSEYMEECEECGSTNVKHGYGEDTNIFVSSGNLANDITFTTDTGSVKNCFRLEAGDDLMTATVANCNPNGSAYIWYVSDEAKSDMSNGLVAMLDIYDVAYDYYLNDHIFSIDNNLLTQYNALIDKYREYTTNYSHIPSSIVGYPHLMKESYNVIDFGLFLNHVLMPNAEIPATTAAAEAAKLTSANLSPVAVQNISSCSVTTANNAVLQMAKTIVDGRYQIRVNDGSTFSGTTWAGSFTVTRYSDEEDAATTNTISVQINDDYEKYVKQKIDKLLSKNSEEVTDVVGLFKLSIENPTPISESAFAKELRKYCLSRLSAFHECGQSCLDILVEQGIADKKTWADKDPDLYTELYTDYYKKLGLIANEIKLREAEIAVISRVQTTLLDEQKAIQTALDFEAYLGDEMGREFAAYRREDTYSNSNYISDGLNNAELFQRALDFIEVAKKDIFKSATLQHSISSSLKNLLVIKEFEPLIEKFEIGNWLRIKIDDKVFQLRLIEYGIDYSNLGDLSVTFSDVKIAKNGLTDVASIQEQAKSMATSYSSVSRQANKGKKSNDQLNAWVDRGLALTKMKIIDNADNQNITWDSHGILCTEYLPITDTYDDKQLKIINKGLYLTDDNWETSRAGIGNFAFYNPETGNMEEAYGVIADTLVGNLVLSEKVGIYNTNNSIVLDENGLIITIDDTGDDENQLAFTIQKKELDENDNEFISQLMYIDENGNLVLNGTISVNTFNGEGYSTLNDLAKADRFDDYFNSIVDEKTNKVTSDSLLSMLEIASLVLDYNEEMLNNYKEEVNHYLEFTSEEGLIIGAQENQFNTVIGNESILFNYGRGEDAVTLAYINNRQLGIGNAVINNTLMLGQFYFTPHSNNDGGMSLMYMA